jgi:hypothetical protein
MFWITHNLEHITLCPCKPIHVWWAYMNMCKLHQVKNCPMMYCCLRTDHQKMLRRDVSRPDGDPTA